MPHRKVQQQTNNQPFDWPFTGKVRTDVDPMLIGPPNFRSLVNMRYTMDGIKGIQGMTPVNASALGYLNIVNGFHYRKDQPAETHVFVQATSGTASRLYKSDNTTAIPLQDTYANFETLENNNVLRFSDAPNGTMMALNGVKNRIWGGLEDRTGSFIVFDPAGSFWYDYTDVINNTLDDVENVATLHTASGGSGSNIISLLHLDNDVVDAETAPKTYTNTDVTFSNSDYIFGGYSAVFNGTNAKLTTPDHADFDYSSTGTFTIDARIKVTSFAANNPIYYQNTTADADSSKLYVDTSGALVFEIKTTVGGTVLSLKTANGTISVNTWYHVSLVESGNNYYLFVGSTAGTAILAATTSSALRCANYTGVVNIGYGLSGVTPEWFVGKMDEYRISKVAQWTSPFSVPLLAYSLAGASAYVYIASTRPLQGVKLYVKTANTSASAVTAYEWNGSGWSAVSSLVDGTSTGGVTLAKTGSISFTSTVATSKIKMIRGNVAYFYQFVFSGVDATTTIPYCTTDAPMQAVKDIWDGSPRTCLQCWEYTTSYSDLTLYVAPSTSTNPRAYVSTDPVTYAQVGGLTSSQYLYMGFMEKQLGFQISMPDSLYVNTSSNTIAYIEYWNGSSWVSVGFIDDSTSTGGISLSHSGAITWQAMADNVEFETKVANDYQFFYYRLHFSETLSGDVRIDNIGGITAQKAIRPYKFAVKWQERTWLCNDQSEKKNTSLFSAYGSNCVFNGADSVTREFGNHELMAGSTIFSRYSSNIYDNMVLCSRDGTYLVDGYGPSTWTIYTVSDKVGTVAPLTFQKCDLGYEVAPGITKHVLVWRSSGGIEYYDGNALSRINDDIDSFFDPASSDYIDPSVYDVSLETGSYDEMKIEYHWIFTNANGKQEWVYNLRRKKWSQFSRGYDKTLNHAWNVQDAYGVVYQYGGTADGFLERLEHGTTFDGNPITCTVWFADALLAKSGDYEVKVRHLKLFGKSKNVSNATAVATAYLDGSNTGITLSPVISQANTSKRIYQWKYSGNLNCILFGLRFDITTTNETIGFEPQLTSGLFEVVREDV